MTYIRRGRYFHDTQQWERDGLTSATARQFVHDVALTGLSIFEATVPRDDNTWADSVSVSSGVKDRKGLRAVAVLRSSDPNAAYKELGHVVTARRAKGERTNRKGKIGPLRRGFTNRYVPGAHTMTKAMRAAAGSGGQVRPRVR